MKACVVITTINAPSEAVRQFAGMEGVDLIVVADLKTPEESYKSLNCIFLSMAEQRAQFGALSDALPSNHYARKNLGYLYAIRQGYSVIIESDDDNVPLDGFEARSLHPASTAGVLLYDASGEKFINLLQHFTDLHIWPRGFPLSRILKPGTPTIARREVPPARFFEDASIIQGQADGEPDVDAIFRLTAKASQQSIRFDSTPAYYKLARGAYCPANTQNTVWRDPRDFYLLYLPSYVSFRFCDILKMYVAQHFVQQANRHLVFQGATVRQDRNPHNFFQDFLQEVEMYVHVDKLVDLLQEHVTAGDRSPRHLLAPFYQRLVQEGVVKDARELDLLQMWLDAQPS